jgi:hypothetical protein
VTARGVAIALLVAAAAAAAALWLSRAGNGPDGDAASGQRVLPGLQQRLNDVTEIAIARGDGTRTTLRRANDGWRVVERDFAADSGKLRRLLLQTAELAVVEEKTRDAARFAVLGVEDVAGPTATGTRLDLVAGSQRWSVILGKASGTREVYARVIGAPGSVLAAPQVQAEADPRRWLDTALVDLKPERVQAVRIALPGQAPYEARRAAKGDVDLVLSPLPRGRALSGPGAATGLASTLAGLQFDDVRASPAAAGADAAARSRPDSRATATVQTFDGLVLTLRGREDGARRYVAIEAAAAGAEAPVVAEAKRLEALGRGREFELANYKYDALFRPIAEMLKPLSASGS